MTKDTKHTADQSNELRIGTVDLAFLLTESVQSAGMHVEMIAEEKLVVVADPMHPLVGLKSVEYRDRGITVIPEIAVRHELPSGELIRLPWQDDCEVGVLMIWQKNRWLPQALKAFMNMVRSAAGFRAFGPESIFADGI